MSQPLHILVLLRESIDPRPPIGCTPDGYSIDERTVRRVVNPSDLCALEQARQLAKKSSGSMTAVVIGAKHADDMLRIALASGAQRAIRISGSSITGGDAVAQATLLTQIVRILAPDMVVTGNRLIDRGHDAAVALAAARLTIPCVSAVESVQKNATTVAATRKGDRGSRQCVESVLPCMLLFEEGCCEPYIPTQDEIMEALDMPLETWGEHDLGLPVARVGLAGAALQRLPLGFPRPVPLRSVTPDAALPAFERIIALLSGGIPPRAGVVHTLSAENTVAKLLEIFEQEGLLARSNG